MNQKLKFGLIGCGSISNAYSQAFEKTEKAELIAVCDIDVDAANQLAEKHGAAAYGSLLHMLDDATIDAVIICTPPSLHAEHVVACAEQGLHIICEKPVSTNVETAMNMIAVAQQQNVVFTMASKFRFVDDVIAAKKLLEAGIIGELVLFENAFTGKIDMTGRWNSNPEISGGGVLIDNGTHSLDIIRYFLGQLVRIKAVECQRIQDLIVDDTVRVFVENDSGIVGNIDLSWSINKGLPTFISLFGTEGTLHVGWQESKYKRDDQSDWTVFGNGYNKTLAFTNQIENFVESIRGNTELVVKSEDAIASVEAVEAAYQSMRSSNWQMVGQKSKTPA